MSRDSRRTRDWHPRRQRRGRLLTRYAAARAALTGHTAYVSASFVHREHNPAQEGACVITSVVVSYQVKPEAVAEHVRLIEAVFEQLHAEQPDNVEYKVVRLDDGISFVHVSSADTPDGSNPLPDMAAFRDFGRDSAARVATTPVPAAADIIGSYYPAVPVSAR
jgi:hypothetical protein